MAQRVGSGARAARLRARLTQADVAERIGLASEVYGRMERGIMRPSVETLRKLSIALVVSTDELLGLQVEPGRSAQPPLVDEEPPELRRLLRRVRVLEPAKRRLVAVIARALVETGRK